MKTATTSANFERIQIATLVTRAKSNITKRRIEILKAKELLLSIGAYNENMMIELIKIKLNK